MDTKADEKINPRYTAGVTDEPKQMLQPITGYAHEPLVSLEEACESLLNIVPRLPAYIWIAKQNSKNPADGLTQDESAAIRLYTMEWDASADEPRASLYVQLNRTLKQVDRTKLRPWFRYLKLFVTALAKLPSAPHQTIWRGVRKNASDDYPPGAEITWWAFSSCTRSLSVLESDLYLGNTGTRTLFSIETINARTVLSHSHFTTEDEILLLPGTFFEVRSRLNPAPDLYIVHLQQKVPPHTLLEPPFEGAQLFPSAERQSSQELNLNLDEKAPERPWYKKKRFFFRIGVAILLVIFIVLLTTLLLKRNKSPQSAALSSYNNNITAYPPSSVAYAFYSFDNNVLDLYSRHDGQLNRRGETYVRGYLGMRGAILLNQSIPTWISVPNPFNFSGASLTIEAFIVLFNGSTASNLIQFSSNVSLAIEVTRLTFGVNEINGISSSRGIPINEWHHVAVVYNVDTRYINLYIDGTLSGRGNYPSNMHLVADNVTVTIGDGWEGIIDQLSISFEAKTEDRVLWDATVAAYYPLEGNHDVWLLDAGPNGMNATALSVQSVTGQVGRALNFAAPGAFYQGSGFVVLNLVDHSFSVALWVRPGNQSGIFLTIANSVSCLLVLGIRNSDNRLVAHLPNATNNNTGVNLIGGSLLDNQWNHVALTWSVQNQALIYQAFTYQGRNNNAVKLNNGRGGGPMSVTIGVNRETADCSGADGIDMSKQFTGSIDEIYIVSRGITPKGIERLNSDVTTSASNMAAPDLYDVM